MAIFRREPSLTEGVEYRWGRHKSRFRPISGYRPMTAGRASNNCDDGPCSLSHRQRRVSDIYVSQSAWREVNRTELNARSGKSSADVWLIIKVSLLLNLATDRHEASRGLSATAELPYSVFYCKLIGTLAEQESDKFKEIHYLTSRSRSYYRPRCPRRVCTAYARSICDS